jgi:MFS family permease
MKTSSIQNLIFYMTGQASWYFVNGLQMVLFPTILILMLGVTPSDYGLAQVSLLAPSIFLIVLGGTIADKSDTRILLSIVHFLASLPLLLILFAIQFNFLSFGVMIIYGLTMGSISAFAIPSRDALLTTISNGDIQRTVVIAMLTQFGFQLTGMVVGGLADKVGVIPLIISQGFALIVGGYFALMLPKPSIAKDSLDIKKIKNEIIEAFIEVRKSKEIFPVSISMIMVGLCFMGNNLVTLPYITTERYGLGASGFATVSTCFWLGTFFSNSILALNKDIKNWGAALMIAMTSGVPILASLYFDMPFYGLCIIIFTWGGGAGIVIAMGRTITQTFAKESHRGRMLSVYTLAFMTSGPIGAIISGNIIENYGLRTNILVSSIVGILFLTILSIKTNIWKIRSPK